MWASASGGQPLHREVREAEVFVATLVASSYTYVEGFSSQGKSYWLEAHANAFEHFGSVPHLSVPII